MAAATISICPYDAAAMAVKQAFGSTLIGSICLQRFMRRPQIDMCR